MTICPECKGKGTVPTKPYFECTFNHGVYDRDDMILEVPKEIAEWLSKHNIGFKLVNSYGNVTEYKVVKY